MKLVWRCLAVVSICVGLIACGSDDDSSSGGSASLSGTASKGIILNGRVRAFALDLDNNQIDSTVIAEATTNSNGLFTLNIPTDSQDIPLYLTLDANDGNALLLCDLPAGCDLDGNQVPEVSFGESILLPAGSLSLSAVVGSAEAANQANMTPLSTVAAQLVEDDLAAQADDTALAQRINELNSAVADRFGLQGLVTDIPIVDLTNVNSLSASQSDDNALSFALLNAAVVAATQADATGLSVNQAITQFAEQYSDIGLSDNSSTESITDLGDILGSVEDVIDQTRAQIPDGSNATLEAALTVLNNDFQTEKTAADNSDPNNVGSIGNPSETVNQERLTQVKTFVSDLRNLSASVDASVVVGSDPETTVGDLKTSFQAQFDAADALSSDDVMHTIEVLQEVFGAIFKAFELNFDIHTAELKDDGQGNSLTLPLVETIEGVTVTFSDQEGLIVAEVDQNLTLEGYTSGVAVDISTSLDYDLVSVPTDTQLANAGLIFRIDASQLASASTLMDIESGLIFAARLKTVLAPVTDPNGDGLDFIVTANDLFTGLNIELDFTLSQTGEGIDGGAMIFGPADFRASFDRLTYSTLETFDVTVENIETNPVFVQELVDTVAQLQFDEGTFSFSGPFANDTNTFDLSLGFTLDGSNATFSQQNERFWQESESSFVAISAATVMFDVQLAGFQDVVQVDVSIDRPEYDSGSLDVTFSYPGRSMTLAANIIDWDDANSNLLVDVTLSNNDGVIITADGEESGQSFDDISGSIGFSDEDTIYAAFDRSIINYLDGTFESLF